MSRAKPNAAHLHLEYLDTISKLINDKHPAQAARFGYIAKQIREKHVIHIGGQDLPKLLRCKACQANIMSNIKTVTENKKVKLRCHLCGHCKTYPIIRQSKEIDLSRGDMKRCDKELESK